MDAKAEDAVLEAVTSPSQYRRPHLGQYEEKFSDVELPAPGTPERTAMEKKLKMKIDFAIIPLVILMYILNYLDRNNIAAAKLGTIMEELNLSSSQFSTVQSILFVGYIPATIPSNILMEKTGRPRIYIAAAMLIWGLISCCIAAVHSYGPLVFLRIILGVFEAAFYPGVIFYLSCWYTRKELAKRTALFISGSWISGAFSGLIAYGVMDNMQGVRGLAAWRWLFIIEGAATMFVAILAVAVLPELPASTRWLTREERVLGMVRMTEDIGVSDEDEALDGEKKGAFRGLLLAISDPKVWFFTMMVFFTAAAAGISAVYPTIVGSLGYDTSRTYLLTAPPWVLVTITSLLNSYHADYTKERWKHVLLGPSLSLIGFIIGISTTKTAPRYVSMFLMLQMYTSYSLCFAWATANFPRPPVKRAAAIAMMNVGANVPNIFTPYLFYGNVQPHFYSGFGFCIAMLACQLSLIVIIRFYLAFLNRKLKRGEEVDGMDPASLFRFTY